MKLLNLSFALLSSVLLLQACSNNTNNENVSPQKETATQQNQAVDYPSQFASFDLDVDYPNNNSYEVDYDNKNNEKEAEIKDERNNSLLKEDKAFEQLRPIFEQLTFDQTTADKDVISEVLKAFNLNNDFTKFELDVEFPDGTEKEYREMK